MKKAVLITLATLLIMMPMANAQVSYYSVDSVINQGGNADVKMTITFSEVLKTFNFVFFGQIKSFQAVSNAGPVECNVNSVAVTNVNCDLLLTPDKRNLEIQFTTNDLVKDLKNTFFFNGDFGINKNIDSAFISVKLPEGMVLGSNNQTFPTLPTGYQILSDGKRIILTWSLANITTDLPFKFQLSYEPTSLISNITNYWMYFAVGVAVTAFGAFVVIRKLRKPKDVILSVLDNFEKMILDAIVKAGGNVNQKKVVMETGLSKAKVSRVIKSLVNRGIVESERRGRTNIIRLVKKRMDYF